MDWKTQPGKNVIPPTFFSYRFDFIQIKITGVYFVIYRRSMQKLTQKKENGVGGWGVGKGDLGKMVE